MDLDPAEEVAPELAVESIDESGPGWLVESEDSLSQDYRLEWIAPAYTSRYPQLPTVQPPRPTVGVAPSQSSSEFAVVPDVDRPGPSRAAKAVSSSDSSLEGDLDSRCCPDSPPSQID